MQLAFVFARSEREIFPMRLLWLSIGLAVLLLVPFLLWGDVLGGWFSGDAAIRWVLSWGRLGWLAVIALLGADLVLPLPATGVMAAAGYIYGAVLGGTISAAGSFASGMLGYGLCRRFGRRLAERLAGAADLTRGEALFRERGPWLVAVSRCLPLLPEVVACLAGVTRMPFRIFVLSLACGSIPMGFVYAAIGAAGQSRPGLALGLSVAVPALLWLAVQGWFFRKKNPAPPEDSPR
jgi:uncharacterized membrane protein YdjX (TVP38/TMEM64 family)